MSERDEFEAWAGRNFLDVTRNRGMVIDYVKPDTQLAWLAWQAARAPQAVPALTEPIYQWRGNSIDNWTDCAKETYDNIGLTLERYPADQPTPTWERRIVYAAPQPSPEKAAGPVHEHYWGYFTDTKTYRCRCGAEQAQYPFGPADYKD